VFDVWQTLEDHDRFVETRLRPATMRLVVTEFPSGPSRNCTTSGGQVSVYCLHIVPGFSVRAIADAQKMMIRLDGFS
jgi:hypothetical protein